MPYAILSFAIFYCRGPLFTSSLLHYTEFDVHKQYVTMENRREPRPNLSASFSFGTNGSNSDTEFYQKSMRLTQCESSEFLGADRRSNVSVTNQTPMGTDF